MFDTHWELGTHGAQEAFALRREVFVDECKLSERAAFDDTDAMAAHLIVHLDGAMAAAARMYPYRDGVMVDFICVKKDCRKQGFGDLCVRVALDKAMRMGVKHVYTRLYEHSSTPARKAYFEAFGFLDDAQEEDVLFVETERIRLLCEGS